VVNSGHRCGNAGDTGLPLVARNPVINVSGLDPQPRCPAQAIVSRIRGNQWIVACGRLAGDDYLDNAKEFHSNALKRGCREHGILLTYRPPQTPHFGGHIERLIGTMMGDLHLLPGTTFSSIKDRGEYKPAKMASLTMRELERWLTLQIVEIYHQRVHRSIGEPPIKAWEKTLASGQVTIRHPADPQKFYIDFLPGELRLIRRDGIQLFGIHYWDNVLSPFAGRSIDRNLIR
jgi:putative transposase